MRFASLALFSSLLTVVSAHFQLQFPPPRGPFVEPNEINFCDSYPTAAPNRSEFPLSGGFISLNSEHPQWTIGVLISTVQNPTSFQNFTTAVNFTSESGEGPFCMPIDLSAAVSGLSNGQNATIQLVFDGGDGQLYQCADLTLSSSFQIPSNVSCTNSTSDSASPSSTSGSSSTGSAPSPTNSPSSAERRAVIGLAGGVALLGAALALF